MLPKRDFKRLASQSDHELVQTILRYEPAFLLLSLEELDDIHLFVFTLILEVFSCPFLNELLSLLVGEAWAFAERLLHVRFDVFLDGHLLLDHWLRTDVEQVDRGSDVSDVSLL